MNFKQIKELIQLLDDTGLSECEIEDENFRIKLSKRSTEGQEGTQQTTPMPVPMPQMPQQPAQATAQPQPQQEQSTPRQEESGGSQQEQTQEENLVTISSPMIGTFYRSPAPERNSYVQVGDTVKKGDILCIIEAMKLFNEIESEYDGKIVKVLVDDASPVEYDQPLFLLEPS